MLENSKQEILLDDLSAIQSEVEILATRCKDLTEANEKLDSQVSALKKEKTDLVKRISELESELQNVKENSENILFNSLGEKEKKELKNNISDLISRIDFHLSADPSRRKFDEAERQG